MKIDYLSLLFLFVNVFFMGFACAMAWVHFRTSRSSRRPGLTPRELEDVRRVVREELQTCR